MLQVFSHLRPLFCKNKGIVNNTHIWPELPLSAWNSTYETLHRWVQVIGKIRLTLSPPINHWWHSALYVTSRGLTTSPIPFGAQTFQIDLDFIDHTVTFRTAQGSKRTLALAPKTVAAFYQETMDCLNSLNIQVNIHRTPNEIADPIPLDRDTVHASYDRNYAHQCWQILVQADRLMKQFRSGFIGKCSPVHFFWGSFDMAVSRFSGRPAPDRPDADLITREAYSHEVSSCGFWPGSANIQGPAFYAYAAPEPPGFNTGRVQPTEAFYNPPTRGYVLMYDDVRKSKDPDLSVLQFFQSTYELCAGLGKWDRQALEKPIPRLSAFPKAA